MSRHKTCTSNVNTQNKKQKYIKKEENTILEVTLSGNDAQFDNIVQLAVKVTVKACSGWICLS